MPLDESMTRTAISRSLPQSDESELPALLGLVILLLALSLMGCSDLPSLAQQSFDADQVSHTPLSPVTASTVPLHAPADTTANRELPGRGTVVTVDTATGTNFVDAADSQELATGGADKGSVAARASVRVSGLGTPFGQARPEAGSRDTLGVERTTKSTARLGAGDTAHALAAHASFRDANAALESN